MPVMRHTSPALFLSFLGLCSPRGAVGQAATSSGTPTTQAIRHALERSLEAKLQARDPRARVDRRALVYRDLASSVVPHLMYHWVEYRPPQARHVVYFVSAGERSGRWAMLDGHGGWDRVIASWRPATRRQANGTCAERIAIEGNDDPNRLLDSLPLKPDTLRWPYRGQDLSALRSAMATNPQVRWFSSDHRRGEVVMWYFDGGRAHNHDRLATRYRCAWDSSLQGQRRLNVVVLDSIVGLGIRR